MDLIIDFAVVSLICAVMAFGAKELMKEIEKRDQAKKKPKILG